jgi:hypothetical protein
MSNLRTRSSGTVQIQGAVDTKRPSQSPACASFYAAMPITEGGGRMTADMRVGPERAFLNCTTSAMEFDEGQIKGRYGYIGKGRATLNKSFDHPCSNITQYSTETADFDSTQLRSLVRVPFESCTRGAITHGRRR